MSEALRDRVAMVERLIDLARRAGDVAMGVYGTDFAVEHKGKNDPVTSADRAANELICAELARWFPGVPVVAEESARATYEGFGAAGAAFFVDPLDGTREFVARNGEFAVMIGLAEAGRPVLGVVHAPARGATWSGVVGRGADVIDAAGRRPIAPSGATSLEAARLVVSRSRSGDRLARLVAQKRVAEATPLGSAGLKHAAVASGEADAYVQLDRAGCLWDGCAPAAIALAAGARVTDERGDPLDFGGGSIYLERGVVSSTPGLHDALLAALAAT